MKGDKEDDADDVQVAETTELAAAKSGKQLKLEGFKPKQIDELDGRFEEVIKTRNSKKAIQAKLNDAKLALKKAMQEAKVPAYGYTRGEESYVAILVDKSEVNVKTSKPDRD